MSAFIGTLPSQSVTTISTIASWSRPTMLEYVHADDVSVEAVRSSIDKGIAFFHSINTQGGYVYYVTVDLKRRWGESRTVLVLCASVIGTSGSKSETRATI